MNLCSCGSGRWRRPTFDARGIFLTNVCDECEARKLGQFRPEVLSDPDYAHEEPIDED